MAGKQYLEPEAFSLYRQNKTQKEIAQVLGLTEATVSSWAKKYEWEKRRRQWQMSTQAISEKLMDLLASDVEQLTALDNGSVDRIMKAVNSIKQLDQSVDMLASTIQVMEDFIGYLHGRSSPLIDQVQKVLPDFLTFMGNKYGK